MSEIGVLPGPRTAGIWTGLICALLTGCLSAQDISQYPTVKNAQDYQINWKEFYLQGNKRTAETQKELPHHLDLSYGDDPKQRLDLYLPPNKVEGAPVLLFLHGGGFKEGDRSHYGFIARPFGKRGIITAIASYRLTTGGFHYPAPSNDAKNTIIWLHENIKAYGGDPGSLYVSGHSAGALLTADISVDRSWLTKNGIPASALKGAFAISGSYLIHHDDKSRDDYTPNATLRYAASPLLHVIDPAPQFLVVFGGKEEYLAQPSEDFTNALIAQGSHAELIVLAGADHRNTVEALADEQSSLFAKVLQVIEAN